MEIEELVKRFEDKTLDLMYWTHEAHLRTALFFLFQQPLHEAIARIRFGIIVYNDQRGPGNTVDSGYHETLTLYWMRVLNNFKDFQNGTFEETWKAFKLSKYSKTSSPLQFYSHELLMSNKARAVWIEPDKNPLLFDF